jgi:hypothetical protein
VARTYLTESVDKVALYKSISAQIRPLIIYISDDKGYVGAAGDAARELDLDPGGGHADQANI